MGVVSMAAIVRLSRTVVNPQRVRNYRADRFPARRYTSPMINQPHPDWFLTDWMRSTGVKQTDLIRELGWSKAKVSDLVNGGQRYNRDVVNDLAKVLRVEPYELLMHPDEAHTIRRLRRDVLRLAAQDGSRLLRNGTNDQ